MSIVAIYSRFGYPKQHSMNKDALLATFIGFGVGLVITGLVFMGPTLLKNFPTFRIPDINFAQLIPKTVTTKPTPPPIKKLSSDLSIESPLADSIESKNEILVSGHTANGATVVIVGETSENVVIANNQGAYAGTITLDEGINEIHVTSYTNKQSQKQAVTVYFTPENF